MKTIQLRPSNYVMPYYQNPGRGYLTTEAKKTLLQNLSKNF